MTSGKLPHIARLCAHLALTTAAASAPFVAAEAVKPVTPPRIDSSVLPNGSNRILISLTTSVSAGDLRVHLNGKNVSARFSQVSCQDVFCTSADVSATDGLHPGKNVLAVDAGHGSTARMRFEVSSAPGTSSRARGPELSRRVQALNVRDISISFLPPTVLFKTNYDGGWNSASGAWLTIGSQSLPSATPANCAASSIYLVIRLDRQTLQPDTAFPNGQCFSNATSLRAYLLQMTSADFVIAGTIFGATPDGGLDTTPIGGVAWPATVSGLYPAGVLVIGTGNATAGSAYDNYYFAQSGYEPVTPFADGLLQEDAYGNYNFESSHPVEYTVSPNDQTLTAITTSVVAITSAATLNGIYSQYIYTPPANAGHGYWLLTLSRRTLSNYPGSCPGAANGTTLYTTCGSYFDTGNQDPATAQAAYQQLASALNQVNSWQLAFLTTVGQPAVGQPNLPSPNITGFAGYGKAPSGWTAFSQALSALGGSPNLTQSLIYPASAYTLVTSNGEGGPLACCSVESTTALPNQGQTGFVHGLLRGNSNGLYAPGQTNQESVALFQAKGGLSSPEFKLTEAAVLQPVDWPSSTSNTLLTVGVFTADSIQGQINAYRYLSQALLNFYLPGIQGSHYDDIHYFFTGSYNTAIDPRLLDPYTGVPYPCSSSSTTCVVSNFGPNADQTLTFTINDFEAVGYQLHLEEDYLANTLRYLVTGSTSLKSVVAGGSANAGLALTGAAASILGSKLVPVPPTQVVTTSWQNIVSMVGGVSSLLSAVPGLGQIAGVVQDGSKLASLFGGVTTAIGGAAGLAAGAGGITSTATSSTLPSAFSQFSMTVGDLANGSMQNQLSAGFDTLADSITSDWGRLQTIGPMTVDADNQVFFSPNQTSHDVAIAAITQAASRSFYIALLPSFYSVYYWQGVASGQPTMGYRHTSGNYTYCSALYVNPQQNTNTDYFYGLGVIPPNSSLGAASGGGIPLNFPNDSTSASGVVPSYTTASIPIDWYVIAVSVGANLGSDNPFFSPLAPELSSTLFTPAGLNLPIEEFVTPSGPFTGANFVNAATANVGGHGPSTVCDAASLYPSNNSIDATEEQPTTTTISVPSNSPVGRDMQISAQVTTAQPPVKSGDVAILLDGNVVASLPVDSAGNVKFTVKAQDLRVGTHTLQARYLSGGAFAASSSAIANLTIYADAPALELSLSTNALSVRLGSASAPLTLKATSISGLSGQVVFGCVGLPSGTTCTFTPPGGALSSNGELASSLVITSSSSQNNLKLGALSLLVLPGALFSLRRRKRCASRPLLTLVILVSATTLAIGLGGCAGARPAPSTNVAEQTTILVTASAAGSTKSAPVLLTVQ